MMLSCHRLGRCFYFVCCVYFLEYVEIFAVVYFIVFVCFFFFFFQAEDGIRDRDVTGVQTCALQISYTFQSAQRVKRFGIGRKSRLPVPCYACSAILLPRCSRRSPNLSDHVPPVSVL